MRSSPNTPVRGRGGPPSKRQFRCSMGRACLNPACSVHQKSHNCTMTTTSTRCNRSSSYCNGSSLLVVDDAIPCATVVGRPVPKLPWLPSGKQDLGARNAKFSACLAPRKCLFKCCAAGKAPDASLFRGRCRLWRRCCRREKIWMVASNFRRRW